MDTGWLKREWLKKEIKSLEAEKARLAKAIRGHKKELAKTRWSK